MIGDEEVNGKTVFKVSFLDFCRIATRTEKRTKFLVESQELLRYIKENRYSKKYIVEYDGIKLDASSSRK